MRKPKPTRIFREEDTYPDDMRRFNSTRQTFDVKQFVKWLENQRYRRSMPPLANVETRFFVGTIIWHEVDENGNRLVEIPD